MRRALGPMAIAACVAFAACNGDSVVRPPMGGGQRNQPGSCAVGTLDAAWRNAQIKGEITQPVKCPYTVDIPNQNITFSADIKGPKETVYAGSGAELGPVYSTIDPGVIVMGQLSAYWQDDPNVSTNRTLTFTGNYQAGHYPVGGPGPWSHDSGTVTSDQKPPTAPLTPT